MYEEAGMLFHVCFDHALARLSFYQECQFLIDIIEMSYERVR